MSFVLDASIALSWCFIDEETELSHALLNRLEKDTAQVPQIWFLEVSNVLVMAEKKQRISIAKISEFVSLLQALPIYVDNETANRGLHEILFLAQSQKITTYDASYLELSMRLGKPLATKDKCLQEAARKLGVTIL
jgi:predicted nucleic acid-binding protein